MSCGLHQRAKDLWEPVFLSQGLQLWLMRRLSLGSLLQISSIVMKAGWWACQAWISTSLPRDEVFLVMSDLCGERTAEKCFYSDHSASLVSRKDFFFSSIHMHIYNLYQRRITLLTRTSFKCHTGTHPFSLTIAYFRWKYEEWRQWDGASYRGTGGVWVIFRQLCLKQWNQTQAPYRVRCLLLKAVLLLSGSAQNPSYPCPEKKKSQW